MEQAMASVSLISPDTTADAEVRAWFQTLATQRAENQAAFDHRRANHRQSMFSGNWDEKRDERTDEDLWATARERAEKCREFRNQPAGRFLNALQECEGKVALEVQANIESARATFSRSEQFRHMTRDHYRSASDALHEAELGALHVIDAIMQAKTALDEAATEKGIL